MVETYKYPCDCAPFCCCCVGGGDGVRCCFVLVGWLVAVICFCSCLMVFFCFVISTGSELLVF